MPAGRPKKTLDDLPENWKKKMLELAAEGGSDVELRVNCLECMSSDLWYRLLDEDKEFSATVKECHELCQAWWVSHGRRQLENKEFSPVLWYMNMKNRYGWKDKHEHSGDPDKPLGVVILPAKKTDED